MVRKRREFNIALLGKWCWRMLVDRGELWYKVLLTRYGEVNGRLELGDRSGSWWREVAKIRDGEGVVGGRWFEECMGRKVGSGSHTFSFTDLWLR